MAAIGDADRFVFHDSYLLPLFFRLRFRRIVRGHSNPQTTPNWIISQRILAVMCMTTSANGASLSSRPWLLLWEYLFWHSKILEVIFRWRSMLRRFIALGLRRSCWIFKLSLFDRCDLWGEGLRGCRNTGFRGGGHRHLCVLLVSRRSTGSLISIFWLRVSKSFTTEFVIVIFRALVGRQRLLLD